MSFTFPVITVICVDADSLKNNRMGEIEMLKETILFYEDQKIESLAHEIIMITIQSKLQMYDSLSDNKKEEWLLNSYYQSKRKVLYDILSCGVLS